MAPRLLANTRPLALSPSRQSWGEPLETYAEKGWGKVLGLNLVAPFQLTRACLPLLDAGSRPGDPARVINVGSISGTRHQPFPTYAYDASKAAVHALTQKLAADLAQRPAAASITVNAIAPGFVPTAMSAQLATYGDRAPDIPLGRWGGAADMAGAAVFLAARSGAWVTGIVLPVDGGVLASPLAVGGGKGSEGEGAAAGTAPRSKL